MTTVTLTPEAHAAVEHLNVEGIDALIALTHADITWHAPDHAVKAWQAIDQLLDRRLTLTRHT